MENIFSIFRFLRENDNHKYNIFDRKTIWVCYRYEEKGEELEIRIVIPREKGFRVCYQQMKNPDPCPYFKWVPTERQPQLTELPIWFQSNFHKTCEIYYK
ncbi:hypothetical protein M4D55_10525 [Metabacillus idriensis]|uniref:hypothetical protein n=1 Tax=Metabacillus idriensis TaxID=324768 RepID=UPI002040F723|nr:hypothetical protein [Metabacillus idriensis]MCM3596209.1 hypothetical protein [Metabacillus idriensis]